RALDLFALGQVALDVLVDLAAGDRGRAAEVFAQADVADDADDARTTYRVRHAGPWVSRVARGRDRARARVLDVGARGAGSVRIDGHAAQRPVAQHLQRHALVVLGQRRQQQPGRQPAPQRDRARRPGLVAARRLARD